MGRRIPIKPTVFPRIEWHYTKGKENLFSLDDEAYFLFKLLVQYAEAS